MRPARLTVLVSRRL